MIGNADFWEKNIYNNNTNADCFYYSEYLRKPNSKIYKSDSDTMTFIVSRDEGYLENKYSFISSMSTTEW